MNCFNYTFGFCSIASYMVDDTNDLEYDDDLRVDNDGCCICVTNSEFRDCPSFEDDIHCPGRGQIC